MENYYSCNCCGHISAIHTGGGVFVCQRLECLMTYTIKETDIKFK